jgi:hypothetical protein
MTLTAAGIMNLDGQMLPFSRDLREALAIYARRTWPLNTSVHAAKAWGIPKSTAANLLKGHASDATVTRIIRSGGWALALPVIGAVIGEPVHSFFREQMRQAAKDAERAEEHQRLASAAYRRLAYDPAGPGQDRRQGRGAGAMGADAAGALPAEEVDADQLALFGEGRL